MWTRTLLALAAALAATSSALAALSECQSACENSYKYCVDKRAMSERACRVEYEKCRRACEKKDGTPSPG